MVFGFELKETYFDYGSKNKHASTAAIVPVL